MKSICETRLFQAAREGLIRAESSLHSDVRATMTYTIYTHTIKGRTIKEAMSPLDFRVVGPVFSILQRQPV